MKAEDASAFFSQQYSPSKLHTYSLHGRSDVKSPSRLAQLHRHPHQVHLPGSCHHICSAQTDRGLGQAQVSTDEAPTALSWAWGAEQAWPLLRLSDQVVPERLLLPTGALGSLAHGTCERRKGGSAWRYSRTLVNYLSHPSFPAQKSGLYEASAMNNSCAVTSTEPGMLPRRHPIPRARRWRPD